MNTPAHAIINLLLFRKKDREIHTIPIVAGALLPDVPIFVFYGWARCNGLDERSIWRQDYFDSGWQLVFDAFHSLPLLGLAWFMAWRARMNALAVFSASMFVHSLFDLPVHHDDAHRHFWPLSDVRFSSPVSYWDPAHFGQFVGLLELLVVMAGGAWLLCQAQTPQGRNIIVSVMLFYVAFWVFALVTWVA
jgi:hypothetical protein